MSMATSSATSPRRDDAEVLCYCKLRTRVCISKTKDNPGKKFRVCPNSLKKGEKCKFWEWVDDDVSCKLVEEEIMVQLKELKKMIAGIGVMLVVLLVMVTVKFMF